LKGAVGDVLRKSSSDRGHAYVFQRKRGEGEGFRDGGKGWHRARRKPRVLNGPVGSCLHVRGT